MGNPIILYRNLLTEAALVTTDMAPWGKCDFGASLWGGRDISDYLRDFREHAFWEGLDAGEQTIGVDCGRIVEASALGLAGHNLKTAGALISLERSTDNFLSDATTVISPFMPYFDAPLLKTFALASSRWWRLKLSAGGQIPKLAVLALGLALEFPMPPEAPYAPTDEQIQADVARNAAGNLLGALVHSRAAETKVTLAVIDRDWALQGYGEAAWGAVSWGENGNLAALWQHARKLLPFFYAWDPIAYPAHVLFGRWKKEQVFRTPLSILAYIDAFEMTVESTLEV
jgi:hypothetical protein